MNSELKTNDKIRTLTPFSDISPIWYTIIALDSFIHRDIALKLSGHVDNEERMVHGNVQLR